MSESFKKFKKQFLREAIITSVVAGVSLGLVAAGIVLLSLRLSGIYINAGFYVLIGVLPALLCGGLVFLVLRPTDKKVAARLDGEYALNERVQTMVEYRENDGDMVKLQREDASEKISALPKRKLSPVAFICRYIVAPVLALAFLFTAAFVPGKPADGGDNPFDMSDLQAVALAQLIEDVKKSDLDDGLTDSVVIVLEDLLEGLEDAKLESVMRRRVIASVAIIDDLFANSNSYLTVSGEFTKFEKVKNIGASIEKSVASYKSSTKIKTLEKVNELSDNGDDAIASFLNAGIKEAHEAFCGTYNDGGDRVGGLRGTALTAEITLFLTPFNTAMTNTGYADKEDGLYTALNTFAAEIQDVTRKVNGGGYTPAALWGIIDKSVEDYVKNATAALSVQMYKCMMDEFIREKLAEIFSIDSSDLPSLDKVIPDDGSGSELPGGKDPDGEHSGGIGPGGSTLAGKDVIYDPGQEKKVEYGEVFSKYYAEVQERIANGEISEELIKIIGEYFKNLDIAKKPDEQN